MTLTYAEKSILAFMYKEGLSVIGSQSAEDLIEQNMTYCNQDDLLGSMNFDKKSLGGYLASLSKKGLAYDTEEVAFGSGRRGSDWVLTEKGIREADSLVNL